MNDAVVREAAREESTGESEADLGERARRLDELAAELDFFSRSVTHDLRAPLRTISGFSTLLGKEHSHCLPPEGREYLRYIAGSIEQMDQLITGMFNLSRATHQGVRRQRIDVTQISTAISAQHEASDPHRVVDWRIAPELVAEGDPVLIRMLLDNLIGNAWKYTSKAAAGLIVVGSSVLHNDEVFFVQDNGAGFDMSNVGNLFNPFQRLHAQSDYPGSGVGLTIVRRIVRAHHGRVWAESGGSAGATFYFTLAPRQRKQAVSNSHDSSMTGLPKTAAKP